MTWAIHARTQRFARAVESAKQIAHRALSASVTPMVSLSAGKDSTALTCLIAEMGAAPRVLSEKDDLDYPGEEDYVRALGARFGLDLHIVRPPQSPLAWLAERRGLLSAGEDMHSRSAGLSKACFYGVMEQANEGRDLLLWGLRAAESANRRRLLTRKGPTYTLANGQVRCAPLAYWTGNDVFAYLQSREVEVLPVYRCCGWLPEHRHKPWLIRKSWWIPGAHASRGSAAWLRHYWPSLFRVLLSLTYDARAYV